jgi:type III secretory pathway component EscR
MESGKRVLPRWMRTTIKIGFVFFLLFAVLGLVARNWLMALGMMAFAVLEGGVLFTSQSKP